MAFQFLLESRTMPNFEVRYNNLCLRLSDIVQILRWANVPANKNAQKKALQSKWSQLLLHGGPPPLPSRDSLCDFPSRITPQWKDWREAHLVWQQEFDNVESELVFDVTTSPMLATNEYNIYERRASRTREQDSFGTVVKLCKATGLLNDVLAAFPNTANLAAAFQCTKRASVVLWVRLTSLKLATNDLRPLRMWYRESDPVMALVQSLCLECHGQGYAPTFHNLFHNMVPFPIPLHNTLRTIPHALTLHRSAYPTQELLHGNAHDFCV
ncbi:Aste57867_23455 [Aphanomyces stellatus]|uniref:Aste57867_23455 protein n=1 Tax=Aphanomyces stellatus TaxID=120398 RepID=A0A485LPL5_9STRA|nr:hypothetical protein As57867_023384 [Aphanomyces stellatus]VFU00101.1 Aste57867_23455 [Aphanomyces stellatus]